MISLWLIIGFEEAGKPAIKSSPSALPANIYLILDNIKNMNEGGYKIRNQAAIHFITFAVTEWIDVFSSY